MDNEPLRGMPPGTELESNEEIERARSGIRRSSPGQASIANKTEVLPEQPYRPTVRTPQAILILCDDGETSGEVFRLRTDRFVIGRTEGDLLLPNDEQVSSRHVALTQQVVAGQVRWVITDLQSRNGLFVRVGKAPLNHMSEFLIGGGRYRLELVQTMVAPTAAFDDVSLRAPMTRAFEDNAAVGSEMLTELIGGGTGVRLALDGSEYWIGSHPQCAVRRATDPFVAAKHAKLFRSPRGTWMIQNNSSINGIWLRVPQIILELGKKCEFQIGEQRFRLRFGLPL